MLIGSSASLLFHAGSRENTQESRCRKPWQWDSGRLHLWPAYARNRDLHCLDTRGTFGAAFPEIDGVRTNHEHCAAICTAERADNHGPGNSIRSLTLPSWCKRSNSFVIGAASQMPSSAPSGTSPRRPPPIRVALLYSWHIDPKLERIVELVDIDSREKKTDRASLLVTFDPDASPSSSTHLVLTGS